MVAAAIDGNAADGGIDIKCHRDQMDTTRAFRHIVGKNVMPINNVQDLHECSVNAGPCKRRSRL